MPALAMILTAAMVVPGDGPQKVSGAIAKPQRLDLRGEWLMFTYNIDGHKISGQEFRHLITVQDEGNGRCRMTFHFRFPDKDIASAGICRQESERVLLCYRELKDGHPTRFREGDGQHLIILRSVKPSK